MKITNLKCNDLNTHSFEHPAEAVHVAPGGGLLGVEVVDDDGAAHPGPVQGVAQRSLHLTRIQVLLSSLRFRMAVNRPKAVVALNGSMTSLTT